VLVRPLDVDFPAELRRYQREQAKGRSRGRHLSEIIKYLMVRIEPDRFKNTDIEQVNPLTLEMGFVWEDVLSKVMAERIMRLRGLQQTEIEFDGIFMTIDGYLRKTKRIVEVKTTRMSAAHPISSGRWFRHWHYQTKGYCMGMGVREAEIWPVFLNGSYEQHRFGEMVCKPVVVEYTQREVDDNWEMILRTRDRMDREDRRK